MFAVTLLLTAALLAFSIDIHDNSFGKKEMSWQAKEEFLELKEEVGNISRKYHINVSVLFPPFTLTYIRHA